jgi:hypothetical protein
MLNFLVLVRAASFENLNFIGNNSTSHKTQESGEFPSFRRRLR